MAKLTFYESFKSQSLLIVPIFLSGLILISLNIYTLVKTDVSETDKYILYSEVFFSFIASSALLLWMSATLILSMFSPNIFKNITILYMVLYALFLILSSPFVLTIIKASLQDKEADKYLSISIVLSTSFSMFYTLMLAFGGF
jgi:hypothetical protein